MHGILNLHWEHYTDFFQKCFFLSTNFLPENRVLASSSQVVVVKLSGKQSNFNFRSMYCYVALKLICLKTNSCTVTVNKPDNPIETSLDIIQRDLLWYGCI